MTNLPNKVHTALAKVAEIIDQMGGKHFLRITGATSLQAYDGGARFTLPAYVAQRQINRVTIRPGSAPGFYSMEFSRKVKVVGKSVETPILLRPHVSAMMLAETFTDVTGMTTNKEAL